MNKKRYPPQPPYEPTKPEQKQFIGHKASKPKSIYYDIEPVGDSEFDLDEYFEDMGEQRPPIPSKRYWEHLTLQDIVDLAPPDTKLSDITFNISYPRYIEYIDISFQIVKRDLKAEEKAFIDAMALWQTQHIEYEKQLLNYNKELAGYNEWKAQQDIKELEEKLAKLKK